MHSFSNALIAAVSFCAVASQGRQFVPGTPDGVYYLSWGQYGQTFTKAADLPAAGTYPNSPRGVDGDKSCAPAGELNHDDYVGAQTAFDNWCGDQGKPVQDNQAVAVVKGSAVAFMCTYTAKGEGGNPCQNGEYDASLARVTDSCGQFHAGKWLHSLIEVASRGC